MADSQATTNGILSQSKVSSPGPAASSQNAANAVSTPTASQAQSSQAQQPAEQPEPKYYTTDANGPPTSLTVSGSSARPRDARTIHMVLASLGVTAYQERVPLQLLDFAYRYTSSVLSDAQHLIADGYTGAASGTGGGSKAAQAAAAAAAAKDGEIPLSALRLATSSRTGYQYSNTLPKETLLNLAAEKNRTKLPDVSREVVFGVRLPHERYIQTGTGWNLAEEWDSEDDENGDSDDENTNAKGSLSAAQRKHSTPGAAASTMREDEDEEMEDEDQDGFEQVFGSADSAGADGGGKATTSADIKAGDEDKAMEDG